MLPFIQWPWNSANSLHRRDGARRRGLGAHGLGADVWWCIGEGAGRAAAGRGGRACSTRRLPCVVACRRDVGGGLRWEQACLQEPVPLRLWIAATCLPRTTPESSPYASFTLSSQNWRCPPMGRYSCGACGVGVRAWVRGEAHTTA